MNPPLHRQREPDKSEEAAGLHANYGTLLPNFFFKQTFTHLADVTSQNSHVGRQRKTKNERETGGGGGGSRTLVQTKDNNKQQQQQIIIIMMMR